MKVLGILLLVVGGLALLVSVNLALTKYSMTSDNDIHRVFSYIGFSVLIVCGGVCLLQKARKKGNPSTPAQSSSEEEPKKE